MAAPPPLNVAVVDDHDLVHAGVAGLLSPYREWIRVLDRAVDGRPLAGPIDVALVDPYGRVHAAPAVVGPLRVSPAVASVVVFSLDLSPQIVAAFRSEGVRGFISKTLTGPGLAAAITEVARGQSRPSAEGAPLPLPAPTPGPVTTFDRPGRLAGLTERESQVLVLAADGLSNKEIAAALYLSAETVKTYLREIFAKLGLRNRVEATKLVFGSGVNPPLPPVEAPALAHAPPPGVATRRRR